MTKADHVRSIADWLCSALFGLFTRRIVPPLTEEELNRAGWKWDGKYWVPILAMVVLLAGCALCGHGPVLATFCSDEELGSHGPGSARYARFAEACEGKGGEPSYGPANGSRGHNVYRCAHGPATSWRWP